MEYQEIIHNLSLLLIIITLAEIYVRQRGLGDKEKRMRDGKIVTNKRGILPPIGLLILSIAIAILTVQK